MDRICESDVRIARLREAMDRRDPDWGTVFLVGRVNQYYFTGSMQDGLLVVRREGPAIYFVRRSFDRALAESDLPDVLPMESYRDAAKVVGAECGRTYLESEIATVALVDRLHKAFSFDETQSVDRTVLEVRMRKSPAELARMEESGRLHRHLLDEIVPGILEVGMSEVDLTGRLYEAMLRLGGHGVSRFSMFQSEMVVGQVAFGESSLVRTSFNGPGGGLGMSAAVPFVGSRERCLAVGDLVFVDVGFGIDGYHSDCTQVYRFGAEPTEEMARLQDLCLSVEREAAAALRPGSIPSAIYEAAMRRIDSDQERHFMGHDGRQVKFLGHGVGLHLDELPVLAKGFDQPLEAGIAIALEPKIGITGVGMVGVEDTYVVTPDGGRCLTGGGQRIRYVPLSMKPS
jgi:Xaa-Pro aminopeptidase